MLYLQNKKYSYNTSPYLQTHLEETQCLYQQQWLAGWKGRLLSAPSWARSRHRKAAALLPLFHTTPRTRTHHLGTLCSSCCRSCSFCESCKEAHCTPSAKERNPSEVRLLPKSQEPSNFIFQSLVCAIIPVLAEMPSSCRFFE